MGMVREESAGIVSFFLLLSLGFSFVERVSLMEPTPPDILVETRVSHPTSFAYIPLTNRFVEFLCSGPSSPDAMFGQN